MAAKKKTIAKKPVKKAAKTQKKKPAKKPAVKKKTVKKKPSKKMGRPKSEIDWGKVKSMAAIFCVKAEICSVIGVSESTLERGCKSKYKETFDTLYKKWSCFGKSSLRRLQYKAAQNGNVTMLIWLGKNMLQQTDRLVKTDDNKGKIIEAIEKMSGIE